MIVHLHGVRCLALGEYDFTGDQGQRYRYLDLYDAENGETMRMSLNKDVPTPVVEFGDFFDIRVNLSTETKVVKGTDRSIERLKGQIVHLEPAKQGSRSKPERVAA